MTKLKDHPWWPTRWSCIGNAPNAGQVSAKATFEACRHSTAGLTIAGDYEGTTNQRSDCPLRCGWRQPKKAQEHSRSTSRKTDELHRNLDVHL